MFHLVNKAVGAVDWLEQMLALADKEGKAAS